MTAEMVAPAWMHSQISAEQYDSWSEEQAATGVPIMYTYVLDPATKAYRDGEMFTGTVKATAPFSITVDLGLL
ncbi:hypothetical protein [Streptomyces sp. NPDC094031]|uniref:hypothetical protein n=1 Tax=Streptomyces sp. NPDC094031 TaxID=3155307 RepID=UPI00331C2C03